MIKKIRKRVILLIKERGFFNTLKVAPSFLRNHFNLKWIYYKLISKNGLIKKKVNGIDMYLDMDDWGLSKDLILKGIREPWATKILQGELKKGMNVLEAGANKGYYLLLSAKLIGKGKVYAFEPDSRSIEILKKNIKLNNLGKRVILHNYALGNKNGTGDFYTSHYHNTSNLMTKEFAGYSGDDVKVKVRKGDDVLKNVRIDYVRMDVEGYEFEILKGLGNKLKKVKGMFIEVHPKMLKKGGVEMKKFYAYLKGKGLYIKWAEGIDSKNVEKEVMKNIMNVKHLFFERKSK